jgi:signal transduction histidine kinase
MDSALQEELAQLRLAYGMSSYLQELQGGFLARTAHELRSPLSSIMGLHQLILNNLCESPEEEREFLHQAYQAGEKLIKIIDEIVQISKINYGTIPLNIQPTDMTTILRDLYELTHLQAANKGLRLEIINSSSSFILADSSRLLQTLLMLVDTTIKNQIEGKITLQVVASKEEKFMIILLESEPSAEFWQQQAQGLQIEAATTLAEVKEFNRKLEVSPATRLDLAKSLLEAMAGKLEIIPTTGKINCYLLRN